MSQNPAIDTDDISIDITQLDRYDQAITAEVPWHCIEKIKARLEAGNANQSDDQIAGLLAQICMDESIARCERDPLWGPQLKAGMKPTMPEENQPFKIMFALDVAPKFDWPDFSTFEIKRPMRTITDEIVARELHQQRLQASPSLETDEPARTDDLVTLDLAIRNPDDDTMILSTTQSMVRLTNPGEPAVVNGIPFTGLDAIIRDSSTGDSTTMSGHLPGSLANAETKDKTLKFEVSVTRIERPELVTVESVLEQYGTPNEEILLMQIRTSLESRFEIERSLFMLGQCFEQLSQAIEYSPPQRVLIKHANDEAKSIASRMLADGRTEDEVKEHLEKNADETKKRLNAALKARAISMQLRKTLDLSMHEGDLQAEIVKLAALNGKRPEELRKELVEANQIQAVTDRVIQLKIFEALAPQMKFIDVDADDLS